MSVQVLELKTALSVTTVLKRVRTLKINIWLAALLVILSGVYGYVSGRQNPVHHYVPYVGYPLVLDTTTGKACYSTTPKPSEDASALAGPISADAYASLADPAQAAGPAAPTGPAIPMCGK